jgi:hypothetical protein
MKTIATLGPEGTFSDLATKSYLNDFGEVLYIKGIEYFKSIMTPGGETTLFDSPLFS